jgi:LacI family transcriptional regulator
VIMKDTTPHVALILETSMAYGRGLLKGITQYVKENRYWSTIIEQGNLNDPLPAWLNNWRGEGVILCAASRRIADLVKCLGVPVVDTLQHDEHLGVPVVVPDHRAIAEAAAEHFLERHIRHFAYVGVDKAHWSNARKDSFVSVLHEAGYPCHVYRPVSHNGNGESWDAGQQQLTHWLSELPKPVGILAAHDLRALCVLDACRRGGLLVPEQVAVLGVDNDDALCLHSNPPLSSVIVDHSRIGYHAAAVLDQLMRGERPSGMMTQIKPLGVVSRRSSDAIAIEDPLTAKAVQYIHRFACEGIVVSNVAHHCGVSRRTLERTFGHNLGISPHEQIVRTKVARVKELLARTDYPLETVAVKSGLSQAAYLNVFFKRKVGTTPGEYRRALTRYEAG